MDHNLYGLVAVMVLVGLSKRRWILQENVDAVCVTGQYWTSSYMAGMYSIII